MSKLTDSLLALVRRRKKAGWADFPPPEWTVVDHAPIPPSLSALAERIYFVLRHRATGEDPRITYLELSERLVGLPPEYDDLTPLDQSFHDALAEIARACRSRGLPDLTAIVVRRDDLTPGESYFAGTAPGVGHDPAARLDAWRAELRAARSTRYPPSL